MICPLCQNKLTEISHGILSQWECLPPEKHTNHSHYIIEYKDGELFVESITLTPYRVLTNKKYSMIQKQIGWKSYDGREIIYYREILRCSPVVAGPKLLDKIKTLVLFS